MRGDIVTALGRRAALVAAVCALALQQSSFAAPERPPLGGMPSLVLWAWERPEDLRGLDSRIGVAFLTQTITVADDRFFVAPRRQPLRVSPSAALLAVTRIEHFSSSPIALSPETLDELASLISRSISLPQVVGVQIDFDAVASARDFYREVLLAVRAQLGPEVPVSITALASWCVSDDWLGDLPIDEAVPMMFRMGPANEPYRDLALSRRSAAEACRGAVGISLDEPLSLKSERRRVYVFSPHSWNADAIADVRRLAGE